MEDFEKDSKGLPTTLFRGVAKPHFKWLNVNPM